MLTLNNVKHFRMLKLYYSIHRYTIHRYTKSPDFVINMFFRDSVP